MRIGASIILLDGYCFQSYQWKFFRPLGSLQNILKFLDLYDVDEICITRPIKRNDSESSLCNDLQLIRSLLSNSPISFGGGLRNSTALKLLHNLPVERLHFSSAFINHDVNIIKQAANLFGKQAIVATLPIKIIDDNSVNGFTEKPKGEFGHVNGGFFVLSPKCIDYIKDDSTSWESEPLEQLAKKGELMAFKHNKFWQPMDTLRDKNQLEAMWLNNRAPWKIW